MFIIRDLRNYGSPLQWENVQALKRMKQCVVMGKDFQDTLKVKCKFEKDNGLHNPK